MIEKGEWQMTSRLFVRDKRLNEGLKKWEGGDQLLLIDELSALPSNSSFSDSVPFLRNGIKSSAGCFPLSCRGSLFGPLSGVLPGPVLQTLADAPDFRSDFGPSSLSLFD